MIPSKAFDRARFMVPRRLVRHTAFYGKTRSGKTTNMTSYECKRLLYCGDKIWDFGDVQGRSENHFLLLPSRFKIWKEGLTDYRTGKTVYAQGLPGTLFFPNSPNIPSELPAPSRIFTIPIASLDVYDFLALKSVDAKINMQLWDTILSNYVSKDTTPVELLYILSKLPGKQLTNMYGIKTPAVSRYEVKIFSDIISELTRMKIISSANCATVLDIKEEYRKKEAFILANSYLNETWSMWVIQHLMRDIMKTLKKSPHKRPSGFFIRELHKLAPKVCLLPQQEVIKALINDILRLGIGDANIAVYYDTQNPSELDVARGQIGVTFVHRINFVEDILALMSDESKEYFTAEDRHIIQTLDVGECCILTDMGYWRKKKIRPPLCDIKHSDEDFFEIWRQIGGKYFNPPYKFSKPEKDLVDADYDAGVTKLQELQNIETYKKQKADEEAKKRREEDIMNKAKIREQAKAIAKEEFAVKKESKRKQKQKEEPEDIPEEEEQEDDDDDDEDQDNEDEKEEDVAEEKDVKEELDKLISSPADIPVSNSKPELELSDIDKEVLGL